MEKEISMKPHGKEEKKMDLLLKLLVFVVLFACKLFLAPDPVYKTHLEDILLKPPIDLS